MLIHSLGSEIFSDIHYSLIGIHTVLEEYKLAYLLNSNLNTKFKRASYNLDFDHKHHNASYPVYEYQNKKLDQQWFLISNRCKNKIITSSTGLFDTSESINYLLPEKKKVDFLLKVEGEFELYHIQNLVNKIKEIQQIVTCYLIDPTTLKHKEFLIF